MRPPPRPWGRPPRLWRTRPTPLATSLVRYILTWIPLQIQVNNDFIPYIFHEILVIIQNEFKIKFSCISNKKYFVKSEYLVMKKIPAFFSINNSNFNYQLHDQFEFGIFKYFFVKRHEFGIFVSCLFTFIFLQVTWPCERWKNESESWRKIWNPNNIFEDVSNGKNKNSKCKLSVCLNELLKLKAELKTNWLVVFCWHNCSIKFFH